MLAVGDLSNFDTVSISLEIVFGHSSFFIGKYERCQCCFLTQQARI